MWRPFHIITAAALLSGGCDWSRFSEYEDEAPALRIEQAGDITSGSFGDDIIGLPRAQADSGGVLFAAGNANAALTTVLLTGSGKSTVSQSDSDVVKEKLGSPDRIHDLAPGLTDVTVGDSPGPFAFVATTSGKTGAVRVLDINRYSLLETLRPSDGWIDPVSDFGLSVASGAFDAAGRPDDVAVGARDTVLVFKSFDNAWPEMDQDHPVLINSGADWPKGDFKVLARGDLDPSSPGVDEVIAAIPDKNAVVVVFAVDQCLEGAGQTPIQPCETVLRLPLPDGAQGFGAALLADDVDGDGDVELVVGAPGSGKVFVYGFTAGQDTSTTPPTPTLSHTLEATLEASGSKAFGAALAFGRFAGGDPLLAVGAPETGVDDLESVGRIYLYTTSLTPLDAAGVTLANPEGKELLGRTLTRLPFSAAGAPREILVAAGKEALFIFFSSLTAGHDDPRDS